MCTVRTEEMMLEDPPFIWPTSSLVPLTREANRWVSGQQQKWPNSSLGVPRLQIKAIQD